jgi:2,6-dihydroxypseudooxynicotine hydrolase
MADSDYAGAVVAYYVGQRVLVQDTPLKRRLYGLSVEAYLAQPRVHPLEVLSLSFDSKSVAGYLQLPLDTQTPAPLILIVPGVGTTKEEFEPFCKPFLDAGYAVARVDMPGFGQTEGIIDVDTPNLIPAVLQQLSEDKRLDPSRTHLFGFSMGAFWTLHAAARTSVSSISCVSGPHRPHTFFDQLPPMQVEALMRMSGLQTHKALRASMRAVSLGPIAPTITTPVRIFHGTSDQTVPVSEAYSLSRDLRGLRTLTVYEGVHHNCLEHFDALIDESLAWFNDPDGVTSHHALQDSVRFTHAQDTSRTVSLLPGLSTG